MGVLSRNGPFKIAHRDDFIAEYLGQTAIKTKKLLKSCLGGVLFIDEVYALAPVKSDRDSFAKEALDTLNSFLSEHKNDFCCIAAGYEDEIRKTFFAMNKGLERRFPWVHKIDKYSNKELAQIFMKMVKEIEWTVAFTENDVAEVIERNPEMFKHYGGDIEVCISKIKMIHSRRVFSLGKEHKFILTKEDLKNTIEYIKKHMKTEDTGPPPGLYI
jgi:SpoVK/Ycf46/Vps4 family AAA+-type ATPase